MFDISSNEVYIILINFLSLQKCSQVLLFFEQRHHIRVVCGKVR